MLYTLNETYKVLSKCKTNKINNCNYNLLELEYMYETPFMWISNITVIIVKALQTHSRYCINVVEDSVMYKASR